VNILDLFDEIIWSSFFTIFIVVFGFAAVLFRRCAYFYFDPGWLVVLTLSIGVTLVVYLYLFENLVLFSHVLYVSFALVLFLIGVRATHFLNYRKYYRANSCSQPMIHSPLQVKKLKQIMSILQLLIILMLLVRVATQGLAIFSEDPEMAKVLVNSGGFGLITRVIGAAVTMASAIAMLLLLSKEITGKKCIWMLMPVLFALLSSGSKGAFFSLLVSYAVALVYLRGTVPDFVIPPSGRIVALIIGAVVGYSFVVLSIRGASETDIWQFATTILGVRFLAFGDALYYFFCNNLYTVISLQPYDYVWDFFISPVLAMFRLIEYPITLGLKISGEMFGMERGGPNPTLFVEGYVYFGYVFGLVYALLIGMVFQYLRSNVFNSSVRSTAWGYLRFSILFSLTQALAADMIIVVGDVVNAIMVMVLVWFIQKLLMLFTGKFRLKLA